MEKKDSLDYEIEQCFKSLKNTTKEEKDSLDYEIEQCFKSLKNTTKEESNKDNDSNSERKESCKDPDKYYSKGVHLVLEGNYHEALKYFISAIKIISNKEEPDSKTPPRLCSLYGLCLAFDQDRNKEGIHYCKKALERSLKNPLLYYNLPLLYYNIGRIYIKNNLKKKAFETYSEGIKIDPNYKPLKIELEKMGIRKKPVISFLPRSSSINIVLGKIRAKEGIFTQPRKKVK